MDPLAEVRKEDQHNTPLCCDVTLSPSLRPTFDSFEVNKSSTKETDLVMENENKTFENLCPMKSNSLTRSETFPRDENLLGPKGPKQNSPNELRVPSFESKLIQLERREVSGSPRDENECLRDIIEKGVNLSSHSPEQWARNEEPKVLVKNNEVTLVSTFVAKGFHSTEEPANVTKSFDCMLKDTGLMEKTSPIPQNEVAYLGIGTSQIFQEDTHKEKTSEFEAEVTDDFVLNTVDVDNDVKLPAHTIIDKPVREPLENQTGDMTTSVIISPASDVDGSGTEYPSLRAEDDQQKFYDISTLSQRPGDVIQENIHWNRSPVQTGNKIGSKSSSKSRISKEKESVGAQPNKEYCTTNSCSELATSRAENKPQKVITPVSESTELEEVLGFLELDQTDNSESPSLVEVNNKTTQSATQDVHNGTVRRSLSPFQEHGLRNRPCSPLYENSETGKENSQMPELKTSPSIKGMEQVSKLHESNIEITHNNHSSVEDTEVYENLPELTENTLTIPHADSPQDANMHKSKSISQADFRKADDCDNQLAVPELVKLNIHMQPTLNQDLNEMEAMLKLTVTEEYNKSNSNEVTPSKSLEREHNVSRGTDKACKSHREETHENKNFTQTPMENPTGVQEENVSSLVRSCSASSAETVKLSERSTSPSSAEDICTSGKYVNLSFPESSAVRKGSEDESGMMSFEKNNENLSEQHQELEVSASNIPFVDENHLSQVSSSETDVNNTTLCKKASTTKENSQVIIHRNGSLVHTTYDVTQSTHSPTESLKPDQDLIVKDKSLSFLNVVNNIKSVGAQPLTTEISTLTILQAPEGVSMSKKDQASAKDWATDEDYIVEDQTHVKMVPDYLNNELAQRGNGKHENGVLSKSDNHEEIQVTPESNASLPSHASQNNDGSLIKTPCGVMHSTQSQRQDQDLLTVKDKSLSFLYVVENIESISAQPSTTEISSKAILKAPKGESIAKKDHTSVKDQNTEDQMLVKKMPNSLNIESAEGHNEKQENVVFKSDNHEHIQVIPESNTSLPSHTRQNNNGTLVKTTCDVTQSIHNPLDTTNPDEILLIVKDKSLSFLNVVNNIESVGTQPLTAEIRTKAILQPLNEDSILRRDYTSVKDQTTDEHCIVEDQTHVKKVPDSLNKELAVRNTGEQENVVLLKGDNYGKIKVIPESNASLPSHTSQNNNESLVKTVCDIRQSTHAPIDSPKPDEDLLIMKDRSLSFLNVVDNIQNGCAEPSTEEINREAISEAPKGDSMLKKDQLSVKNQTTGEDCILEDQTHVKNMPDSLNKELAERSNGEQENVALSKFDNHKHIQVCNISLPSHTKENNGDIAEMLIKVQDTIQSDYIEKSNNDEAIRCREKINNKLPDEKIKHASVDCIEVESEGNRENSTSDNSHKLENKESEVARNTHVWWKKKQISTNRNKLSVDLINAQSVLQQKAIQDPSTFSKLSPPKRNALSKRVNGSQLNSVIRDTKVRSLRKRKARELTKDDDLPMKRKLRSFNISLKSSCPYSKDHRQTVKSAIKSTSKLPRAKVIHTTEKPKSSTPLKRKMENQSDSFHPSKVPRMEKVTNQTSITTRFAAKTSKEYQDHSLLNISHQKALMFEAVQEGNIKLVKELISITGPTIRNDKDSCTLLHIAASNNQYDTVFHLLNFMNPNLINKDGQTPAHMAAREGHVQVLRLLLADKDIQPNKKDSQGRTYMDLLAGPLFDAVLKGEKNKISALLKLGANPDYDAGSFADGIMSKELRITTPRQLAFTIHGQKYLPSFSKGDKHNAKKVREAQRSPRTRSSTKTKLSEVNTSRGNKNHVSNPNTKSHRGHVCILNFKTFPKRPELEREASVAEVSHLSKVFGEIGYTCDIHDSLTESEVRNTLIGLQDSGKLNGASCAIFLVSSHGVNKKAFLTSDMKLITTEWMMGLFRESDCPQLRNKPKIFIFDFTCGYYMETLNLYREQRPVRMQEPICNTLCLYSQSIGVAHCAECSFVNVLRNTLKNHSLNRDFDEFYRQLLNEYTQRNDGLLPEFSNIDFTGRFYINPIDKEDILS
ncbi:uncharacterized protein [Palaemon carinicauda]|uniref:uncharacterized protein n=1 Tax=Palaemon carinicauda TaxID=392227 RepID=UPI0035B57C83